MGGSQTTTQTATIPQFQQNEWQNLLGQENSQTNADIAAGNSAGITSQIQGNTQNILNQQLNPSQLSAGITNAGQASQGWTNPGTSQSWMNPYESSALQSQLQLGQQNVLQPELASIDQGAAASGALGGDRDQVAKNLATQGYNSQALNTIAQGENTAYNTGLGAFQSANAQNLQGQTAGAQTQLAGANSNIYANFAAGQNDLNSIAASEAPGQQLQSEAGVLAAQPYQGTTTGVTQQSPGSWLGGILSAGLGAVGSIFKGAGSGNSGGGNAATGGAIESAGGITAVRHFDKPRKPRHKKKR
jgi:hypothetical protein